MWVYDGNSKSVVDVPRYHVADKGSFSNARFAEDADMSLLVLGRDLEKFFVYVCCANRVGLHDVHDGSSLPLWVRRREVVFQWGLDIMMVWKIKSRSN